MGQVAVLCARRDSIYKDLVDDVYDEDRDARTWTGGCPVVAHPPCRSWGRLKAFAKPSPGERDLARWCVEQVATFGGVLEHPAWSDLWADMSLPRPAELDGHGFTLPVSQHWFGHKARKDTWLYIVGVLPIGVPEIPFCLGEGTHVVSPSRGRRHRPSVTKREREATPEPFARWLIKLASRCRT